MTPTQLRRAVLALVIVVFLWGASKILGRGGDDPEIEVVLPALSAVDVDTVTIIGPADTIVLSKRGTDWTVNGYAASPDAVDRLFTALGDSSSARLVATSDVLHTRMGVDLAAGKRVRFVRGQRTLAAIIIGKPGQGYNSTFVRRDGENPVYQYTGEFTRLINQQLDDWRDKQVADVEPDSVGTVVVSRSRRGYTLSRAAGEWRVGSVPADSAAVRRLLNQYHPLAATGFPTAAQLDSVEFDRPDLEIALLDLRGDTLVALALDSTTAAYWLRRRSDGTVFRVLQWKVNQLAPADSTLR
jgi:hypothetical protein